MIFPLADWSTWVLETLEWLIGAIHLKDLVAFVFSVLLAISNWVAGFVWDALLSSLDTTLTTFGGMAISDRILKAWAFFLWMVDPIIPADTFKQGVSFVFSFTVVLWSMQLIKWIWEQITKMIVVA